MRTKISTLFAIFILSFYSCNINDDEPTMPKAIELDEKAAQLVKADNAFGFDIFKELRAQSEDENLLVSPLSISLALAMTYNGANGDTQTEMEEALKLKGLTPDQINSSYKLLIGALQSLDEDVVFEIANAIFYKEDFPFEKNFIDLNKNFYDAEVTGLDFGSRATLETINKWVAHKTKNKIEKILDDLSPNTVMVLLNAIYFYGTWTVEFDEDGTKMRNFNLPSGENKEVPMMSKEDKLDYFSNNLLSAIKLPYGNGQYNMALLLPAEGQNSQVIIDELSTSNWEGWNNQFKTTDNVVVTMPRFKFESDLKLAPILYKLGMEKAFLPVLADFSKMSVMELYISRVIHKTLIDVNETGTEAAAVTAVEMGYTSANPDQPQKTHFTVDRPFLFAITEKDTEAILFIGEVKNPVYEE